MAINVKLAGGFATVDLDLSYINPSTDCALEATYEFPLEKSTLLAKLEAELDGKKIEAQVRKTEAAKEKYEDAVAGGKAAVLAQRTSTDKEILTVKLGNLLPEKVMRLQVRLIMQLEVVNGSYHFAVPMAYFPDYSRHGLTADAFPYEFSYSVSLISNSKIQNLSIPESAAITSKNETNTEICIQSETRSRKVNFYWRTRDMMSPNLLFAKNPKTSEVACLASLVPTFEPPQPQE